VFTKAAGDVDRSGSQYVLLSTLALAMGTHHLLHADMSSLFSCRLAVKDMLQRRQQHNMAQAFAGWQLYVATKHNLRSISARLAQQTRLNALKLCFGMWREECKQQQASRLQKMAARVLQRWEVRPLC
jgi:hypothetical protein